MSKSNTKADLERMLAEAQSRNRELEKQNESLRQSKRPVDALVFGCNITFSKKTHQELVGTSLGGVKIPPEAITMYFSSKHECKLTSNGNVMHYASGWIDTRKLELPAPGSVKAKPADKATASLADKVAK